MIVKYLTSPDGAHAVGCVAVRSYLIMCSDWSLSSVFAPLWTALAVACFSFGGLAADKYPNREGLTRVPHVFCIALTCFVLQHRAKAKRTLASLSTHSVYWSRP